MSVGLGVGDIVKACQQIYILCKRYHDAHDEFDEICTKAKSTEIVLRRLDEENEREGNIVTRAGPEAFEQLKDNLESLRGDSEKLQGLVKKYDKIHDDGPGRRLLWALRVSSDLTDLRRRIGYHEQTLQLWYMTLVYGSLRRLEGGQEEIIETLKGWDLSKIDEILDYLHRGDDSKLKRELLKCGVTPENVEVNLATAIDYVTAPPIEKVRMESHARQSSASATPFGRTPSGPYPFVPPPPPRRSKGRDHDKSYDPRMEFPFYEIEEHLRKTRMDPSHRNGDSKHSTSKHRAEDYGLSRSKSTSSRPKKEVGRYHDGSQDAPEIVVINSKSRSASKEPERNKGKNYIVIEKPRPRRSSEAPKPNPPPSPLLAVPSESSTNLRPQKYYEARPKHRRTRSEDVRRRETDEGDHVIVVEEIRSRSRQRDKDSSSRNSSTHSYVRVRSGSNASNASEAGETVSSGSRRSGTRIVQKMDRIDSIPLDEDGNPVDIKKK